MSSSIPIYASPVASSVPFDNSTNGFASTDVQSAIEESTHHLSVIQLTDVSNATTASSTDAVLTTMTTLPSTGTYLVMFNCSVTSATAGAAISFSIYVNGVQDSGSLIKVIPFIGGTLTSGSGRVGASCIGTAVVTSGQTVAIEWSSSSGTATCGPRRMILTRIL